ncbi:twitching motility protein PilT [Nocardioides psychrotolerans]|uniref:Twitching motility protein PilT n=1 Tax=Nocardioides psychrotolerans TaxID=1005945 RepID=A0A1I3BZF5_9ACTN|nr:PilT/PilU family type 4a pilus ATPase [Nocardioides psychrotolerans]GEP36367.1 twitching motility protein PilT [Nocardioides psychrotolerans]SFH67600.1 twitching motility protein PilT [Nocardioides psychrotolerans]
MPTLSPELTDLLAAVHRLDGSDLHLRGDAVPKIRVSGELRPAGASTWSPDQVSRTVRDAMSEHVLADFEQTWEADFAVTAAGLGRFRVNAFRSRGQDGAVFRRISDGAVPLEQLGMPDVVRRLALRPRGLVLVTGPTGSGKSTTLSAMVDAINAERAVHILTLEDPIEVVHREKRATVTQRELGSDTRDWPAALRAAMRQDPDVILIGELRDADTVRAALSAAETGHVVLSSMHTTDARETVLRLIDFFPAHEQPRVRAALAVSLEGVVCQRLVPRRDQQGRVCVLEVAVRDARFSEAVADPDRTHGLTDVVASGSYSGMQTFDQHLIRLVTSGTVDLDTALVAATNPHDFTVALRRTGWAPEQAPRPVLESAT